jgi:CheY-like chemotaxis protein
MTIKKKPVILMADDDEDDRVLVREAFLEIGLESVLTFVDDGQKLIDYLQCCVNNDSAPCPDLILLDLNMPKKDGRTALKEIKSDMRFRYIPVVIMTTSKETIDVVTCYRSGANTYISKPPSFDQLTEVVNCLHQYWFKTAVLPKKS